MSHFYGGIDGSRGPATRQGTKQSGYQAYAQGYGARISVRFHYNDMEECDDASISIGGGYSSHAGSRGIHLPNVDAIVEALDSGDPKINRIWERIQSEFDKLQDEAVPAVLRAQRRQERQRREEERERRRALEERRAIIAAMSGPEKLRLHKLMDVEFDANGNPMDMSPFHPSEANLRYDDDASTVLVDIKLAGFKRSWSRFTFDVTNGVWVLDFEPEDGNLEVCIRESGYPWRLHTAVT